MIGLSICTIGWVMSSIVSRFQRFSTSLFHSAFTHIAHISPEKQFVNSFRHARKVSDCATLSLGD
jgi:hypothetical protein